HLQRFPLLDVSSQELLGQRILQVFLHSPAHRSSAVGWIESLIDQTLDCGRIQVNLDILGAYPGSMTFATSRSTILTRSFRASWWKTIMSSNRFKNSGLNPRLDLPRILSRIASYDPWPAIAPKPSAVWRLISSAPTFEVIMIIVFRKSIFWPRLSVILPSSRIWSSRCMTSG